MPTRVRVGIVSWNTAELLSRCLDALPAALAGVDADVVVVDNASRDGSVLVAGAHDGVEVIRNATNVGYAKAMNQALRAFGPPARPPADVYVALNPDAVPPPGSLATLVQRLEGEPDLGLVAPRLVNEDGSDQHSVYRFPSIAVAAAVCFAPTAWVRRGLGARMWLEGWSDHAQRTDIDWAIGAVHVFRADAIDDRDRPYDETWFMYAEDLDLCWRIRQRGGRIRLEGDVVVPHRGNAAGEQAWGAARTVRWQVPTYDWYRRARGPVAVRAWAVVHGVGVVWLVAKWRLLSRLRPRRWGHLRAWARQAAAPLPVHWRVAVGGVGRVAHLARGAPR